MDKNVREIGKVIEISGDLVTVLIKRHASCESCGACGLGGKSEIKLVAKNDLGAIVGDQVCLELQAGKMYQAAFLVYTVPLLMLFVGYYLGQAIATVQQWSAGARENTGIFGGVIAIGVTYWAIHQWERRKQIGKRFQPKLVEIIRGPGLDVLSSK
ncbi:MAG TPA: SoxR reducing system RseC family protein [Bacillota bacterium]|nr:SoxR reducing system RseC family protein [Bacillota bacterium]